MIGHALYEQLDVMLEQPRFSEELCLFCKWFGSFLIPISLKPWTLRKVGVAVMVCTYLVYQKYIYNYRCSLLVSDYEP